MAENTSHPVDVISPGGELGSLPQEVLGEALAQGYRLPTKEELAKEARRTSFEDRGAAAFGLGALRGATLGLSDIALSESGAVPHETIKGLKEFNPGISLAGDIVGTVTPALISGGASTLSKGASILPAGMIAQIGKRVAEGSLKGATKGLVETGLNPGAKAILAKMTALGAAGAVEGGLYGGAHAINEQYLDAPPQYAAEVLMSDEGLSKIISGTWKGAAFGGAVGAGVAGVEGALAPVTRSSLKKLQEVTEKWFNANRFAVRAMGPQKRQLRDVGKFAHFTDEQIDEALERGNLSYLDRYLKGVNDLGADINAEGLLPGGFLGTSISESRNIAQARAKEWGQKIGALLSEVDDDMIARGEEASVERLRKSLMTNVINPLKAKNTPEHKNIASRLERLVKGQFEKPIGYTDELTLQNLHQARVDIDDILYAGKSDPTKKLYSKNLLKVREAYEDFLEQHIKDATRGTSLLEDYKLAKRKYASMKWAQETAENRILSENANNFLSLTDKMFAGAAGLGTSVTRGGIDPSALAVGLFAGLASKIVRNRGASMIAGGLHQLNALGKLNQSVLSSTRSIESAIDRFLEASPSAFVTPISIKTGALDLGGKTSETTADQMDDLLNRFNDPQELAKVEESLNGLGQIAPNTALAMSINTAKAIDFLRGKIPKKEGGLYDQLTSYQYNATDFDRAKWERFRTIAEHPMSVLDDLGRETLTPEAIETLETLYPAIYDKIRSTMMEKIGKKGPGGLSYQKRLSVSKLFKLDLDPSIRAQNIEKLQRNLKMPTRQAGSLPRIQKPTNQTRIKGLNVTGQPTNIQRATMR